MEHVLIINTGNTSTKVGLYQGDREILVSSIKHSDDVLARYQDLNEQLAYRKDLILKWMEDNGVEAASLTAVAARGGLLKPLQSGTYLVCETMLRDLREGRRGMHASHLSAQIGHEIASEQGIKCYVVDPISVDELQPEARYSGHALFERISLSHALNMKAVAKRYAREQNRSYPELRLIVVHLGTGVSLSSHLGGRMIDISNPSEEGPFSLDRAGSVPVLAAAEYLLREKLSLKEFRTLMFGKGGLFSYLGTMDFMKVEADIRSGDAKSEEVVRAMAYQIAKEIGAQAAVLEGDVHQIIFTGGMAHARFFVDLITRRTSFISDHTVYPGEDEIQALALGVLRVLRGEETARSYDD